MGNGYADMCYVVFSLRNPYKGYTYTDFVIPACLQLLTELTHGIFKQSLRSEQTTVMRLLAVVGVFFKAFFVRIHNCFSRLRCELFLKYYSNICKIYVFIFNILYKDA